MVRRSLGPNYAALLAAVRATSDGIGRSAASDHELRDLTGLSLREVRRGVASLTALGYLRQERHIADSGAVHVVYTISSEDAL